MGALPAASAMADDKSWYAITWTCSSCNEDGTGHRRGDGKKANLRAFISTPVYAGKYDYECKEGAFYSESGQNGWSSGPYPSETKLRLKIRRDIRDFKSKDFTVHRVRIGRFCD